MYNDDISKLLDDNGYDVIKEVKLHSLLDKFKREFEEPRDWTNFVGFQGQSND